MKKVFLFLFAAILSIPLLPAQNVDVFVKAGIGGSIKLVDKRKYEALGFAVNSEVRNFASCIVVGYRF